MKELQFRESKSILGCRLSIRIPMRRSCMIYLRKGEKGLFKSKSNKRKSQKVLKLDKWLEVQVLVTEVCNLVAIRV